MARECESDDETVPLISTVTPDDKQRKVRLVTVEPIIFLFIFGRAIYTITFPQFIKARFAADFNLSSVDTSNGTCSLNKSSPNYQTQEEVQQQATLWTLYLNATSQFLAMFTATILCTYSDRAGRKLPIILPPVGALLNALVYLIVIHFNLPLYYLFIGAVLQGLAGGHTTELAGCFSYLADITVEEKRRFRFGLLDVTFYLATAISQVLTGYLIETFGFEVPFWIMFAGMFVIFFYALIFLKESIPSTKVSASDDNSKSKFLLIELFKNIGRLFKSNVRGRRLELIIGNIVLLLQFSGQSAATSLYVLYLLDVPFCWSPIFVGYFNAIRVCLRAPGILIGSKLFPRCLSELSTVHVSLLSFISSFLLSAFAYNDVMLFTVPAVASIASLTLPLVRARLSRLVGPSEQGVLFACIGCVEAVANFIAPTIFNAIYATTLVFFSGFAFLTLAVSLFIGNILICLLQWKERKQKQELHLHVEPHENTAKIN